MRPPGRDLEGDIRNDAIDEVHCERGADETISITAGDLQRRQLP